MSKQVIGVGVLLCLAVVAGWELHRVKSADLSASTTRPTTRPVSPETRPAERPVDRAAAAATMAEALKRFAVDHDRAAVREALRHSAALDESFAQPRFNLAMLAEGDNEWAEAVRWLGEAAASGRDQAFADRAREELPRATRNQQAWASPDGRRSLEYDQALGRARVFLSARRLPEALAEARRAAEVDASRYEAHCLIADARTRMGDVEEAATALAEARKVAPREKQPLIDKAAEESKRVGAFFASMRDGDRAMDQKAYADAARAFEAAREIDPRREDVALRAATAFLLADDLALARTIASGLTASKDLAVRSQAAAMLASINGVAEQRDAVAELRRQADVMRLDAARAQHEADEALGLFSAGAPGAVLGKIRGALRSGERVQSVSVRGAAHVVVTDKRILSEGVPADLTKAISDWSKGSQEITRIALGDDGTWVILTSGSDYWCSSDFNNIASKLKAVRESKQELTDVELVNAERWCVLAGRNGWSSYGVPDEMSSAMRELNQAQEAMSHVALSADGGWVIIRGRNGWRPGPVPAGLEEAFTKVQELRRTIGSVALTGDGGWIVVAQD